MHAGFFSFHSSRATIRWLKTESDDIWMFGSPWISGGEPQHCPLSFSPILTETVCTVKCGSPGEIKPHHQLHPSLQDDSLSLMPSIFFCLKKKKSTGFSFLLSLPVLTPPPISAPFFFLSFYLRQQIASFGLRGCQRSHQKMFGTTSSGALNRERLQPQPQLSSSSSAAAEEFPARVLQQIVSHHLRCLGKYPSTVGGNTHRLCVGPLSLSLSLSFPLSVSYLLLVLLFFFLSLRWEKMKHHCTEYTVNFCVS